MYYGMHHGLARTRPMGSSKKRHFLWCLAAMVVNIRKETKFLTEYGLPE